MLSLRLARTATLAALALTGALSSATHAATLVQVDLDGVASGFVFPIGPHTGPFSASFSYDSDPITNPGAAGHFILTDFVGIGSPLDSSDLFIENDVTSGASTVDRMTVTAAVSFGSFPIIGAEDITLTLEFSPDFLPAVQLPTLTEFQSALSTGKLLSASAVDNQYFLLAPFPFGFDAYFHTVTVDGVSATLAIPFATVPTPAAATAALPLLALTAARRRRA